MWQVFYGDTLIGDPRLDLPIYDKDLEVELNTTGKFEFTLGDSHPMNGKLVKYQKRDEVKVLQDGDIVFCGRVVEAEQSFDRSTRYTCEGDRGYLNDAIVKPYRTGIKNVPDTAHGYFAWLVAQYNDSMDPGAHFTIGINQGPQITTKVDREQTTDTKVWAEMKAVLVDDFGCYVRTRRVKGVRYIDLLVEGDKTAIQRIRFGENLMDFSHRTGGEEYYTRVFARGGNYGDAAADKAALEQLVSEAQQIPQGDKSDSAKDSLDGEILKARVVLYDTAATQSEADAELSQLQDAIRKFYSSSDTHDQPDTRLGDKTQLQATYSYVAAMDRSGLSDRSKASLIAALSVAAEVLANQWATQAHVNAAQSALDSATNSVRAEGDDTVTLERMSDRGLLNGYALHGGWVVNEAAERELGVIEGTFTDDLCTDEESLLASALRHLINVRIGDAIEMTAFDLHNVDPSVKPIRVGDYVRATSRPHGFDEYFICTSRKYDLDHPENDEFSLGSEYETLTGAQSKKLAELNADINSAVDQVDAATALAGSKAAIFSSQPSVYVKNDLWVQAPSDGSGDVNILVATADSDGTFDASDWERASDYTNDDAVLHLGQVYANYVEANDANITNLQAETAKIEDLTATQLNATVAYIEDLTSENITATDLTATHAYIADLEADNITASDLSATHAYIADLEADNITAQDLSATHAYIADLEADNVTAQNLIADHAEVGSLDANYAQIDLANIANGTIKSAMIDDAQITNAKIANGTIENAKIKDGTIETAKIKDAAITTAKIGDAQITTAKIGNAAVGTANIKNAAITNALIANEAVSSSQILSVSANKLTAGTINAAEIDVTNLHASSLIVDKLNGQPVLGGYAYVNKNISGYSSKNPSQEGWYEMTANGFALSTDTSVDSTKAYYTQGNPTKLYDQDYIDGLEEGLNQRIDGAIETFTGDHVPTLNTYPAVDWTTDDAKSAHVGDIYFVTNSALAQDGYNYRFAYDNTTQSYLWVLIKDSDVTKALGDISDLQSFESTTTSWINTTDQGLTTIRQNHTALSGRVDSVAATANAALPSSTFTTFQSTTFAELVDEVDEQSSTITSMSETMQHSGNLLPHTSVTTADREWLSTNIRGAWADIPIVSAGGYDAYKYDSSWAPGAYWSGYWCKLRANTYYTYSIDVYYTKAVSFNMQSLGHFQVYNANSSLNDKSHEDIAAERVFSPSTVPANTWTRVSVTFLTNSLDQSSFAVYPRYNLAAGDGTLYFKNAQLEYGKIATGWSPSSFDLSTVTNTVNSVKQTADANTASITGLTTTTQALRTDLDNLDVGGRNLVLRTGSSWRIPESGTASTQYTFRKWAVQGLPFVSGEQITVSGNAVFESGSATSLGIRFYDEPTTTSYTTEGQAPISDGRFKLTLTVSSVLAGKTDAYLLIYAGPFGSTSGNAVTISNLKLERGNVATDWSPAPEDVQGSITTLESRSSKIEQTLDGFSSTVGAIVDETVTGTNILTGNALNPYNWTISAPTGASYTKTAYGTAGVKVQFKAVVGCELFYSPAITVVSGKKYTLSVEYTVGKDYIIASDKGGFGLSVYKAVPTASYDNANANFLARAQFVETATRVAMKATVTFTATSNTIYLGLNGGQIQDSSTVLEFTLDKLVLVENISSRMSSAETTISQTANNVLIKATKSDTTAAQGGQHLIQSLINVAPSGITINADKVNIAGAALFTSGRLSSDSLSNTYDSKGAAAAAVNSLEISARNIFVGSSDEWTSMSLTGGTNQRLTIVPASAPIDFPSIPGIAANDMYTVSFDLKFASGTTKGTAQAVQGNVNAGGSWFGVTFANDTNTRSSEIVECLTSGKPTRIFVTIKITDAMLNGTHSGKTYLNVRFDGWNGTVYIKAAMVQKGSKATDWTPAPEDQKAYVDSIVIGGTNLLHGTADFSGATGKHANTVLTPNGYMGLTVASLAKTDTSTYADIVAWHGRITPQPSTWYTLSFWAKASSNLDAYSFFYASTVEEGYNSSGQTTNLVDGSIVTNITTKWERHWITWKTLSTLDGVTAKNVLPIRLQAATTGTVYIAGVKFEQGNKASSWSPAPEDQTDYVDQSTEQNLAITTGARIAPADYGALDMYLSEALVSGQQYTLKLWDVNVSHSGKTASNLGVFVYYCGGQVCVGNWTGTGYFTNGHADELDMTFTPYTNANTITNRGAPAGDLSNTTVTSTTNKYIRLYNSVSYADGTKNLTVGKWKLIKGSSIQNWSIAPEDIVSKAQLIYYRTSSSTKPSAPSTWVTEAGDKWAANNTTAANWTTKVTPISNGTGPTVTKYLYLWTCEQSVNGAGTLTNSAVLLDDTTTVIDGGKIITGSVSANAVSASSGYFDVANIPDLSASKITSGYISADRIAANSLTIGKLSDLKVGGTNLVWDSEWHDVANRWTAWGSPTTREIVTVGNKRYLHIVTTTTQYQGYQQNGAKRAGNGEVEYGDKVMVSFTAYAKSSGQQMSIGIHWLNSSGSIVAQTWFGKALTTSAVRYVGGPYSVPSGCVSFNVMVGDAQATAQEIWIGEVKIEKGTLATDYSPAPEDAAATATNYIKADSTGIKIAKASDTSNYQYQTSSGTDIYVGGKKRTSTNANGLEVFDSDGTTSLAKFSTSARIGKASAWRAEVSSNGLDLYGDDNVKSLSLKHFRDTNAGSHGGTLSFAPDTVSDPIGFGIYGGAVASGASTINIGYNSNTLPSILMQRYVGSDEGNTLISLHVGSKTLTIKSSGISGLAASDIPNLAASQITSGTFDAARIPSLAASKITSGTFGADRIPSLAASKIGSGTLPVARGGTNKTSGEFFGATRIYSSTATCTTFTLTASAANYSWLTILYKGNDGFFDSVTVFNNKAAINVALSVIESTANGTVNIKRVTYQISGTSATVKTYGEADMANNAVVTASAAHVTVTGVWGWV